MKKYGFRILVGLIAFAVSISAVILEMTQTKVGAFVPKETEQTEISNATFPTNPIGRIEVGFVGYGRIKNRPTIIFEIINHSPNPVYYSGSEEKQNDVSVKFNGKEYGLPSCILRAKKEFSLESGESFKKELFADVVTFENLRKKGSFEFGFSFYFSKNSEFETWSKPIIISEKLKKEIIKNYPESLKR